MARYSISNTLGGSQQNLGTGYKTLSSTNSPATVRRTKIYDITVGTVGTPSDITVEWDVSRMTAAGTGTTVTCLPLDPADAAALTVGTVNYTAEPTITAASSLLYIATNVRATYRWVAAPGSELVTPASNLAGLVVRARSASFASTASSLVLFEEQ